MTRLCFPVPLTWIPIQVTSKRLEFHVQGSDSVLARPDRSGGVPHSSVIAAGAASQRYEKKYRRQG